MSHKLGAFPLAVSSLCRYAVLFLCRFVAVFFHWSFFSLVLLFRFVVVPSCWCVVVLLCGCFVVLLVLLY